MPHGVFLSFLRFAAVCSLFLPAAFAQVLWSAHAENGFRTEEFGRRVLDTNLIVALEGNISYGMDDEEKSASVKFRLRPELVPVSSSLHSLRYRITSDYTHTFEDVSAGITAVFQRNLLFGGVSDLFQDIFIIRAGTDFFHAGETPVLLSAGYGNQNIQEEGKRDMNVIFIDALMRYDVFQPLAVQWGAYVEKFNVASGQGRISGAAVSERNSGYRAGPHVAFNYSATDIVSVDYRFLFHTSSITANPSYEHTLRCLAGTNLGARVSLLFLFDINYRHFTLRETAADNALYYYPFDTENKLALKFVYDTGENSEVYLRGGYSKENLLATEKSFDSWNVFIGFRIEGM